jgi:hypothetical protein
LQNPLHRIGADISGWVKNLTIKSYSNTSETKKTIVGYLTDILVIDNTQAELSIPEKNYYGSTQLIMITFCKVAFITHMTPKSEGVLKN